ncbi:MAG: sigma-70 family RNA polymerase sigma factor [Clostridia bacterium]|nr:sigma-70 family RNA polymerase sigma factor [Clostridia bacterium]
MTDIESIFNEIYDTTYRKTLIYVTAKCSDIHDIEDILQEIYTELYNVLKRKGKSYIQNNEAFIQKIAKIKVYKYYTLKEKLCGISLNSEDQTERELIEYIPDSFSLEDELCTKETYAKIGQYVFTKSVVTQKIFALYYLYDLKISEIAELLSTNESYVKNKLYRTVNEIKKIYGGYNE